jgi:tetratricopeptide (TPR) repeat protein
MILPFQYTYLLWLLVLLPLIIAVYFIARQKRKIAFKKMGDPLLVKELTANFNTSSPYKKFLLLFSAMALILLSLANFRSPKGSEKITRNGIDVMIALDVSNSMLAQDITPNRLDRAKQLLYKLIDKLDNDRIGIVVFAGKAYLQMPLTGDHSAAKMYLSAATPQTIPTQGTVISEALKMCYSSFNSKEKKYKAVVLISDGEDHEENALTVAEEMAKQGVVINTIGMGTPEGAPIMDPVTNELKKDEQGVTVITKLNEQALADIAKKGNGDYKLFSNTDAVVNALYNNLSTMDKRTVNDDSLVNYKSWFQLLLGASLLFLILELFITEVKKGRIQSKKLLTVVLLILIVSSAAAQAENENIKLGNDAYKIKDYQTAIKYYNTVAEKNNATANYNLGNALYKSDKKEEAIAAYEKAAEAMTAPLEKSNTLYNKGVVLQNDKKTDDCILNYKNALKIDPNNIDARHNLQIALQKQKEDKQKQDQQNKNDKKDDNKNNNDEQPKPQQSNLTQKDAEQKLQALLQKEKELQDKLHKIGTSSPDKPEKDW